MIFFDLDNTLLAHDDAEGKAITAFYQKYQSSLIVTDNIVHTWKKITDTHRSDWRAGKLTYAQQRCARMSELFIEPLSERQAGEYFAEFYQLYQQNWSLYPDTLEAIKRLSVFPLGVISNGYTMNQMAKLEQTGLSSYFKLLITSESAGVAKPSPDIFRFAANLAGGDIASHWYIGNNADMDAQAAHNAGMKAVWLNRINIDAKTSTRVVRSLTGFSDLLLESYQLSA